MNLLKIGDIFKIILIIKIKFCFYPKKKIKKNAILLNKSLIKIK